MRTYPSVGIAVPELMLPREGVDLTKWAVIACDQFTSEPDYWSRVEEYVGEAPSTLNLIYPEVYLDEDGPEARITSIQQKMKEYVEEGVFVSREGMSYVERELSGKVRRGVVLCLDLDRYDYRKGARSLIRATEQTILERLPPRVKIRQKATLELPHIMVLIDDPDDRVLGVLGEAREKLEPVYDFELMMDSGHVRGFRVAEPSVEREMVAALEELADKTAFASKYELGPEEPLLLFAMGDGNHSLATAKASWEEKKKSLPGEADTAGDPARYAMVELVNLHEESLLFEPIHRVLFGIAKERELLAELRQYYAGRFVFREVPTAEAVHAAVREQARGKHLIGAVHAKGFGLIELTEPDSSLPAGSLQLFLDEFLGQQGAGRLDYVHGIEPVLELGSRAGNMGFILPALGKHQLFRTVIVDGALPRKTFSMGEAWEKRFYMECRKLG